MNERVSDTNAEPSAAELESTADEAQAEATANPPDDLVTLVEEVTALRQKAAEYLDNWQRSHAEFLNFRRRTDAERAEMASFANAALITKLLPIVDDFDLAVANIPAEARESKWTEGVTIIQRKLLRLLETEQVMPIEAQGQPFDPARHEAVMKDEDAHEPFVVVAELRKGYRLGERILRPTLVRVGNQTTAATDPPEA